MEHPVELLQSIVIQLNYWDVSRDYILAEDKYEKTHRIVCTTTKKIVAPRYAAIRILMCMFDSNEITDPKIKEPISIVRQTLFVVLVSEDNKEQA